MKKYLKSHAKTINLKYQLQRGLINLNSLMNHSFYLSDIQDFFEYIYFQKIFLKKHEKSLIILG